MSKRKTSEVPESEASEPVAKKIAPMFLPKNGTAEGVWKVLKDELMIFTSKGVRPSEKVIGFDLDGTLIKTKSGNRFPKNDADWQLWGQGVPKKIAKSVEEGYKICIFTNQKGIQLGHVNPNLFKKKIQAICGHIGAPIQVFVSLGPPAYRKPYIGMWKRLEEHENDGIKVLRSESLYVGDAAGRIVSKIRSKKDHSAADRLFASNLNLRFQTPEQFFLDKQAEEPYNLTSFDPKEVLRNSEVAQFDPENTRIPGDTPEVIVFVGYPGSGKSTVADQMKKEHGYTIVSRDELKTWEKCVARATELLKEKKSVIVDCTNPDVNSRQRYVKMAQNMKATCRCFVMATSYEHSIHNNAFRLLHKTDKAHAGVSTMEPTTNEGFSEVVKVNFVPTFQDPSHREVYEMFLTD